MEDKICQNCWCWNKINEGKGECRSKPPSVVTIIGQLGQVQMASVFPNTMAKQWCFNHIPMGEEKKNEIKSTLHKL